MGKELLNKGYTAQVTEGLLYLTALRSLDRIDIQFVPKELELNRQSDMGEIRIVGRNNPFYHYTGGSNSFKLELDFYSEDENREDVVAKCRLLESWAVNDGYDKPPERIRITFGKLFKPDEVWVIKGVNVKYSFFDKTKGFLPRQAYATLDLVLDTKNNRKISDVQWT